MTVEQTAKLLTLIGTVFPKLNEGTEAEVFERVQVWNLLLGDIDYQASQTAVLKLLRNNRYQPTPADVIWSVRSIEIPAQLPTQEEAWTEVLKKLNPYIRPKWTNQVIGEAVRVMGYLNLCSSGTPAIDRAQFFKIYTNLVERQADKRENAAVMQLTNGVLRLMGGGSKDKP